MFVQYFNQILQKQAYQNQCQKGIYNIFDLFSNESIHSIPKGRSTKRATAAMDPAEAPETCSLDANKHVF